MTDPLSHGDEERAAQALLAAAGRILADTHRDVPAEFVTGLFGRAVPEDLMRYDAREIAELAAHAWALFAERKPGTARVRLGSPAAGDARLKAISVLEVVNDDMPFLVDSVMGELAERGLEVQFVVHPIFSVERDAAGRLRSFERAGAPAPGRCRESFIHIHLARIDDEARRARDDRRDRGRARRRPGRRAGLARDARPGRRESIAELKSNPPPLPVGEIAEAIQFLQWLTDDNFTFLGVRNYEFSAGEDSLDPVFESGLGVLRARDVHVVQRWNRPLVITPEIRAFLNEPTLLIVTKSAVRSRVHRRVYMDYVGVKRFDAAGKLVGEFRIVGLFTSTAYTRSARSIPYLRRKIDAVMTRAGFDPDGHSGKALINVLETYPRDDLFQIDEDTLFQFSQAILQLDERPRVRVLPRRDRFDRFVSVLVYVPRDRYASAVRERIGALPGRGLSRPRQRLPSVLPGRADGARALHHRPQAGRATRGPAAVRRLEAGGRRHRAHLGRRVRRQARADLRSRRGRARCSSAIAMRFPTATGRTIRRTATVKDLRIIEGLSAVAAARRRLPSPDRYATAARSASRSGATTSRSGCPIACRCWRTWASRWSTSGPTGSTARTAMRVVWFHDMALLAAGGGADVERAEGEPGSRVPGDHDRRRRKTTATTRSCSTPA